MNKIVVPTTRYNYVHVDSGGAPVVPGGFQPDEIELDVIGGFEVDSSFEARLTFITRSCPLPSPTKGTTGLTHVRVFVSAPGCDIGEMSVKPREYGGTIEVIHTTAHFRQPRARFGSRYIFSVELTPRSSGTKRLEFGVQAAELSRPVLLSLDLVVV